MRDDDVRESFWMGRETARAAASKHFRGKTNDQARRYVREEYLYSRAE
jgi:hypothetical protein